MNRSFPIISIKLLSVTAIALLLPLSACMKFVTQQGNVLKAEKLADVQVGDSRFQVESLIGTPVLKDDLHPNRAIYMEDYNNPDTGEKYQHRVEIIYNESGRVKSLKRFGFDDGSTADKKD
ncbi:MAG: outer membrane protein assembly factor BamE [Zetaproteobacteria bacterium CG12_big_fil_rev_8_21_14_0_65_55_1124]|nr:MAG: outer membrane protein assembly factor BamE [Zetaproteobacteria bacterium CG08_land_8_20_14_0_20_55_17]PIW43827.1 MAG: outer membrane protein assembly factor BamE [Zetaproteobacteria bacterium CG12_big_fil_rev_8_21_14_0_65_55_1124]PIY52973.1 MAG: outer membrane protein assembly factor BamE [Zetaproteobacteria bacterium CG_4_10_14_0_8_um_filter_55_43]PIZ37606.1 MAG: outer membrane protein assembly factor BamE [Zetaproteobacteria bacterium CG_4_10_14_0_2_um_filter_55_20]PJB79657.1 MAG: ou